MIVLTFLVMAMMGLSNEKTVACFPGSLLFSLEGFVGLCKPVLTGVHPEFFIGQLTLRLYNLCLIFKIVV